MCFFDLFLGLDSAVENWTVTTLTQNLLVERALAALALCPEVTIFLLVELQLLLAYDVDILQFSFAIPAHDIRVSRKYRFAAEAGSLDLCELKEANLVTTHRWLVYIPRVFSLEDLHLGALT